jgi:hypothetical protein
VASIGAAADEGGPSGARGLGGGLNDWLIDGIVGAAASRKPVKPSDDVVAAATGAGPMHPAAGSARMA